MKFIASTLSLIRSSVVGGIGRSRCTFLFLHTNIVFFICSWKNQNSNLVPVYHRDTSSGFTDENG